MSEVQFSNYHIDADTKYFIYIGELKNYGINIYLREALSRIHNHKFDFISIVPDLFEQYGYKNLIVINPVAHTFGRRYGKNVNCRISAKEFVASVSESHRVKSLVRQLLERQENLYIYMYESLPEMTLDRIPGVSILGPDSSVAHRLNNKIFQYESLQDLLPVADFKVSRGYDELLQTADSLWNKWTDGIFISQEYSAAGINSTVAHSAGDIESKFNGRESAYLLTRYIPHEYDPTVLAVVADPDKIYIAGVADQRIEGGNRFTGSTFPSVLEESTLQKLKDYTKTAGRWLAHENYRGIFGCDYIVDPKGEIRFLEINARKQGTTLEFCCTLEQALPKGAPMLPELEYHAVTRGCFPPDTMEMQFSWKNLHWGTFNYKLVDTVYTNGYIPQGSREREAFGDVAGGTLKKHFLILEHTGSDFVVANGSFIGRIVALGQDAAAVRQGIEQGRRTIELTFQKYDPEIVND